MFWDPAHAHLELSFSFLDTMSKRGKNLFPIIFAISLDVRTWQFATLVSPIRERLWFLPRAISRRVRLSLEPKSRTSCGWLCFCSICGQPAPANGTFICISLSPTGELSPVDDHYGASVSEDFFPQQPHSLHICENTLSPTPFWLFHHMAQHYEISTSIWLQSC